MNIFLSYSSHDRNIAEKVNLALVGAGHQVFFDQTSLEPSEDYTSSIQKDIDESDYFIFLISPASVKQGTYTLSELKFAQLKWSHPKGIILPVMIEATDYDDIPSYLRAVTLLEPQGNIPAEVVYEVNKQTRSTPLWSYITSALFIVALSIGGIYCYLSNCLEKQDAIIFPDSAPKIVPTLNTHITLGDLSPCFPNQAALLRTLNENFMGKDPHIKIETTHDKQKNTELFIRGECSDNKVSTTFHFEPLVAKGPVEVYEPTKFSLKTTSQDYVTYVTSALAYYLQRDYKKAAQHFRTAKQFSQNPKVKALLHAMEGNSWLFHYDYDQAIKAYQQALEIETEWGQIYANLGIAQMNRDEAWNEYHFEPVHQSFLQAIKYTPDYPVPSLMQGAIYSYRAAVAGSHLESKTYLTKAEEICEKPINSKDPTMNALVDVCLVDMQLIRLYREFTEIPPAESNKLSGKSTEYWAVPLLAQGLMKYKLWEITGSSTAKKNALKTLREALEQSMDDVQLQPNRGKYAEAKYFYDEIMKEEL